MKSKFTPLAVLVAFLLSADLIGQVSGFVMDTAGSPLADATVSLQGDLNRTTTAADGSFSLPSLSGSNLKIVAGKKGYYNASVIVTAPAMGIILNLEMVVVGNDPGYTFLDPPVCGGCHPQQEVEWTGSRMAHTGQNLWVYDVFDGSGTPGGNGGFVYTTDSVHATALPGGECAACHQPQIWIAQAFSPMDPLNALSQAAANGVSCEVCHKIADVDTTKLDYPGVHATAVTFNRPASPITSHQVQYGTLPDADFSIPGLMRPSYQPQLKAEMCATCHQDKNDPDENGIYDEPNGIVAEPTWNEWLASPYSDPTNPLYETCTDCHMPPNGQTNLCALAPVQRDPSEVRTHDILGTSPEYLENAVDLSLTVQQTSSELQVTVDATNNHAGHHVPTGVPIRNMILLVEAWRIEDGQKLIDTGSQQIDAIGGVGSPAQGYFAGLPGKTFAKVTLDANGNGPSFFTEAASVQYDTRLPALATDTTNYSFQLLPGGGSYKVRARLIYRRAYRDLVDAKGWTTTGHGEPLEDLQAPYFGHLMEEATWSTPGAQAVTSFGTGCNGLVASWTGEPSIGTSDFTLTLGGAQPGATAILIVGNSTTQWGLTPLPLDLTSVGAPGCSLLVSPDLSFFTATDGFGNASLVSMIPFVPALAGFTLHAQWLAADPSIPLGWAFSNGLSVTAEP